MCEKNMGKKENKVMYFKKLENGHRESKVFLKKIRIYSNMKKIRKCT